jgi:uncharacterized protein (DUF58 family)
MRTRTVIKILLPVILLAASLIFGSILLLRMFIASSLLMVLSYIWTLFSLRKINVESSQPPEHAQVGGSFKWQATVSNADILPQPRVLLRIATDLPGQQNNIAAAIPAKGSYTWNSEIKCLKRGMYHLGKITITASDPFGIFNRSRVLGEAKEFIVYPPTIDLPHFKFSSFSDLAAGYRSINRISTDASGIRDYYSGDSLNHIHWQSTARTGKIMVKLFDADRTYTASKTGWVLLDMHTASHFNSDNSPSYEHAIAIAASVIKKYVQGGMRVGLLVSGNETIKPDWGDEHQWRLLKDLALVQTNQAATFQESIGQNTGIFKDNPLVVLIATSITPGLIDTVQKIKNWGGSIVVVHLEIVSWGGQRSSPNRVYVMQRLGARVFSIRKTDELASALDSKATTGHLVII